jgi:hypothetical protein
MAVRDDEDIALFFLGIVEAWTLVFILDFVDQCIKATDHVVGGSVHVSMRRITQDQDSN